MRQAGRYLPEYRQTRARAKNFLDLCYSPELASEVTLQPMRRFDLDAAIVFSDILVVPDALGQTVAFVEGEGPVLEPVAGGADIARLDPDQALRHLGPVMETLERVRGTLAPEKTLIGFCGGPWTVATYMIGGRGSSDQAAARLFALREPEAFAALMAVLIETSAAYLAAQFRAGADVVQIFESWAGNLDERAFEAHVVGPTAALVARLRRQIPDAPVIGFARGAGPKVVDFVNKSGVDAVGLDQMTPTSFVRAAIAPKLAVQGNLDPLRLCAGGDQMIRESDAIIAAFAGRPHIFNLGHGVVPETPLENVAALVERVKGQR